MQRLTITMDDDLTAQFDEFMARKGYTNRSEALRDLVRERLERDRLESGEAPQCIATLSYVFNHHERELARRLTQAQHDHHDLALSTLHVHLDHDNCLEAMVLRGATGAVRRFADRVIAERGVRHGNVHVVPAEIDVAPHAHGPEEHAHDPEHGPHVHSHPKT